MYMSNMLILTQEFTGRREAYFRDLEEERASRPKPLVDLESTVHVRI